MSLFVDGNISQVPDLTEFESSLTEVASTEGIDLSAKLNVARLELSLEVQKFLVENQFGIGSGIQEMNGYGIENVVVTESLKQWHTLQSIAATYRDAYNQQLNDRYKGKWTEYAELAKHASEVAFAVGIGISHQPIPKPGRPILTQTIGSQFAGTWYVATSWTNRNGVESAASETSAFSTGDGSSLRVAVSKPPSTCIGWNIYVGTSNEGTYRQNESPLMLSSNWLMPSGSLKTLARPNEGQKADTFLRKRNLLRRG